MELLENGAICKNIIKTLYFDCDAYNRMKLSSILRHTQQISLDHSDLVGVSESFMDKIDMVFLLGKMSLEIKRLPKLNEKIIISTITANKPQGATYKRITSILEITGEKIIDIDARWILVDKKTGKIVKQKPDEIIFPDHSVELPDYMIRMPKKHSIVGKSESKITYSNIDGNFHTNNANYADIICDGLVDVMGIEMLSEDSIGKFAINYKNQSKLGDVITSSVNRCENNEKGYYICGNIEDKVCYESYIEMK